MDISIPQQIHFSTTNTSKNPFPMTWPPISVKYLHYLGPKKMNIQLHSNILYNYFNVANILFNHLNEYNNKKKRR